MGRGGALCLKKGNPIGATTHTGGAGRERRIQNRQAVKVLKGGKINRVSNSGKSRNLADDIINETDPVFQVVAKKEMIGKVEAKVQSVSGNKKKGKEGGGRTHRDLLGYGFANKGTKFKELVVVHNGDTLKDGTAIDIKVSDIREETT